MTIANRTSDDCPLCESPQRHCLCGLVRPAANQTKVWILRHFIERGVSSNSGRLLPLALRNCKMVMYGDRDRLHENLLSELPANSPRVWLLFPGGNPTWPSEPPEHLVTLDAGWSQARRMWHRIEQLRGATLITLDPARIAAANASSKHFLRRPPQPGFLPTALAVAAVMHHLEGPAIANPLVELYQMLISRSLKHGRPLAQ